MERHSFRIVSSESPELCRNCTFTQNLHNKNIKLRHFMQCSGKFERRTSCAQNKIYRLTESHVSSLSIVTERDTTGGSRAAATSKMERFMIIVNGLQLLTIITKRSILDLATALDPPLNTVEVIPARLGT